MGLADFHIFIRDGDGGMGFCRKLSPLPLPPLIPLLKYFPRKSAPLIFKRQNWDGGEIPHGFSRFSDFS